MAKKIREFFAERIGDTITDMANAASVAATGSSIGVLELAAEDEIKARPHRRKVKTPRKKKAAAKKSGTPLKKKLTALRRKERL